MHTPTIEPPRILPESVDRRLYRIVHGLPHSPVGDRYVTILSDLGEGLGWVGAGLALAWLGGSRGRRAGLAASVASLGTTYLVQRLIKPVFRRHRPHVGRDVLAQAAQFKTEAASVWEYVVNSLQYVDPGVQPGAA